MAEPTIQLGGGNWAGKTDNLLGYYKEGERFYKQDFTFSRSTTGTYTDKDGYIQEMPYNKLTYSEDFSNAAWLKTSGVTVTSNYGVSPDGKQNSTRLQFATNNEQVYDGIVHSGNTETASIYVKGQSGITMQFGVGANISQGSTYTLTGEWQRLEHQSTSGSLFIIGNKDLTATDIEIWGAQLVKGTSAKTYFPTTTRLNMPRVDYLNNSNGSLILEPQRTNLATYSSELENAAWTKSGVTISANDTTSPDGTTNADKIIASSGLSIKIAYQVISSTNSVAHTVSAFYKADEYSYAFLRVGGQTPSPYVIYNLLNQSVVSTANATSTKIEDYGSGWYRVSMTYTANSATNAPNIAFLPTSGYTLDSANQPSYNGDGSSGGYIYGVQLEANASYPTTLINTSGSSVTRNQDACSISNVADRIGQTEGTIYAEIDFKSKPESGSPIVAIISLNNNVGNLQNTIILGIERQSGGINRFYPFVQVSNSTVASIIGTTLTDGNYKAAFAYKQNDFVLYVNGIQIGTDNSGTVPTTSQILVGQRYNNDAFKFGDGIKETKIYNTRLSNSELATLTT